MTFWPQDFPLLAWLMIMAAFSLFAVTAWLGRVWCGYTCPQTVWTAMFMWSEQFCEGSRNQRIKLDKAPWSVEKFIRKFSKHAMWTVIALVTGFTFVAYFSPAREMLVNLFSINIGGTFGLTSGLGWWKLHGLTFSPVPLISMRAGCESRFVLYVSLCALSSCYVRV